MPLCWQTIALEYLADLWLTGKNDINDKINNWRSDNMDNYTIMVMLALAAVPLGIICYAWCISSQKRTINKYRNNIFKAMKLLNMTIETMPGADTTYNVMTRVITSDALPDEMCIDDLMKCMTIQVRYLLRHISENKRVACEVELLHALINGTLIDYIEQIIAD